jgi:hypothetical protein
VLWRTARLSPASPRRALLGGAKSFQQPPRSIPPCLQGLPSRWGRRRAPAALRAAPGEVSGARPGAPQLSVPPRLFAAWSWHDGGEAIHAFAHVVKGSDKRKCRRLDHHLNTARKASCKPLVTLPLSDGQTLISFTCTGPEARGCIRARSEASGRPPLWAHFGDAHNTRSVGKPAPDGRGEPPNLDETCPFTGTVTDNRLPGPVRLVLDRAACAVPTGHGLGRHGIGSRHR